MTVVDEGALNFVVVGAGPTGVETAGAMADAVNRVIPKRHHDVDINRARIYLVDHGSVVLAAFSDKAHTYAADKLQHNGVHLKLGTGVTEIAADRVKLSDGTEIPTLPVIWGGRNPGPRAGGQAGPRAGPRGTGDVPVRPHRRRSSRCLRVSVTWPTCPTTTGTTSLSSARSPSRPGRWAAKNIVADIDGKPRQPFHYKDKGIMAMIGSGSAVAEMGADHHEGLHLGHAVFAAWLGVHAWLMSGVHERVDAFLSWGWDFLGSSRSGAFVDEPGVARIDWGDETDDNGVTGGRYLRTPRTSRVRGGPRQHRDRRRT